MLKLIDNRLTAEVLYTLQKMGHGDVLIIADANFPSTTISKSTVSQSVLNMENLNASEAIEAIFPSFRWTPLWMISQAEWKLMVNLITCSLCKRTSQKSCVQMTINPVT